MMIENVFPPFAQDPADYTMTSCIQKNLYHSAREAICKLHGMSAKTSHSWRRIWIFGNEPQQGF